MVETDGVERMVLPAEIVTTRHWDLRWAIVGRFFPDNNLNKEAMRHTIANVWRPGRGMYVEDLEEGRFLFQFAHEADVRRVMEGGPWNFDNHLLIFQRVKSGEDPMKVDLEHIFLWMQVHNLPVGYRSERVARSLGKYVGGFLESDSNNFSGMWKSYMRIRVQVHVNEPLKKELLLSQGQDTGGLVKFQFERLPTFCYGCGIIGHGERTCLRAFESEDGIVKRQFGPELRANNRQSRVLPIGEQWLRSMPFTVEQDGRQTDKDGYAEHVNSGGNSGNQGDIRGSVVDKEGVVNGDRKEARLLEVELVDKEGGPTEGNITDCLIVGEVKRPRSSVAEHVSLMGPSSLAHDISDPNNRISVGAAAQAHQSR